MTPLRTRTVAVLLLLVMLSISGCRGGTEEIGEVPVVEEMAGGGLTVSSPAFEQGGEIPARYSCLGEGLSPPLFWQGVPEGVQSLALVMDDPDAPGRTWDHWLLFNIPSDVDALAEGAGNGKLPEGTAAGSNSWDETMYGGPCPPRGTHRYNFQLYALDALLDLESGAKKETVLAEMEGHILASDVLTGTFTR